MKKGIALAMAIIIVFAFAYPAIASGGDSYERKIIMFDKTVTGAAQDTLIKKFGTDIYDCKFFESGGDLSNCLIIKNS